MEKMYGPLAPIVVDNLTVTQFLEQSTLLKLSKPYDFVVNDGKIYFSTQDKPFRKLVKPKDICFFSKLANSFGLEISIENGEIYIVEAEYSVII